MLTCNVCGHVFPCHNVFRSVTPATRSGALFLHVVFVSLAVRRRRWHQHNKSQPWKGSRMIIAVFGAPCPCEPSMLLILISGCLGACFVAALWELGRPVPGGTKQQCAVLSSRRAPARAGRIISQATPGDPMRRVAVQAIVSSVIIATAIWLVIGPPQRSPLKMIVRATNPR